MFNYSRFEELRKEKGITKTFIGEQLGRSHSLCQGWKEKKSEPNAEQLRVLASLLDTTPEYLTGESDEKKPLVNGDEELTEYLTMLRDRPEMRMLFSVTKNANRADVEAAVRIIEALRAGQGPE